MKTVIRISNDYLSNDAYNNHVEEIDTLVNEHINCHCEVANKTFHNLVEEQKRYATTKDEFKNKTIVDAIGYSQGDWQQYTIYHNLEEDSKELCWLIDELKKSFTHMNDYVVEKFEREEINGKNFDAEPHDYTSFSIRDIEFPEKNDILERYNYIYGIDYDEVILDIN
jgi:hypothetical protein